MTALDYSIGDPPGMELLEPTIAHTLRCALASYRTPTATRARMLAHLGRASAEIEAALALAKTGAVRRVAGGAR